MFKAETRDKDDVSTAMTEYLAGSSTTTSSSASTSTSSSSSSSSSFESSSSTPITRKVQGVGLPGMSPPLISGGAASVGVDSNFSKPTRAGRGSRTVAAFEDE